MYVCIPFFVSLLCSYGFVLHGVHHLSHIISHTSVPCPANTDRPVVIALGVVLFIVILLLAVAILTAIMLYTRESIYTYR